MADLSFEREEGFPALIVAGVDEVGRGCLAGPVVAAALIPPKDVDFKRDEWLAGITDSKLLTPAARDRLAPQLELWAHSYAIGVATVEEIDRINIYHASHLAMRRALEGLNIKSARILVDGNVVPKGLPAPGRAVVKGDQKCLSIAAASIIAKVWRDRRMDELEREYPGYGFANHKGYATPEHQKALKELGPCKIHRTSFRPVREAMQNAQASLF